MRATSSSAVRRPPSLLEIVPPVATRRTRGVSCACADHPGSASVRRRVTTRRVRARMAPLYLRGGPGVIERQPPAEELDGFLRRGPVEGHHGAGTARRPGNLCAPPVADRRHFDAVLPAVDGFIEALDCHGEECILIS